MNLRVTVLYCNKSVLFQIQGKTSFNDIIQFSIDSGFGKQQMLNKPGVYIPSKNLLLTGDDLKITLEQQFRVIDIGGPPIELLVLRQEEFDQYESELRPQPSLSNDTMPPDIENSQKFQSETQLNSQPPLSSDMMPPDIGNSQQIQQPHQQPSVDNLMPQSQFLSQDIQKSNQDSQSQQFKIKVTTVEGLQKKSFVLSTLTAQSTPNDVKDHTFNMFALYDRSVVDLDLYYENIHLAGVKASKTFSQLSIPSGSEIRVKARWTGGQQK